MAVFRVGPLPDSALEAAAKFHAEVLPEIVRRFDPPSAGEDLVLVFPPAPHDHRGWRLAAVQDLARAVAPRRANGVAGADETAIAETADWLARAPGVTGQLLAVDGNAAERR